MTDKLLVHGKGKKDRTVPIPETITQDLNAPIERLVKQHDQNLAAGYDGVFLDDAVEKISQCAEGVQASVGLSSTVAD